MTVENVNYRMPGILPVHEHFPYQYLFLFLYSEDYLLCQLVLEKAIINFLIKLKNYQSKHQNNYDQILSYFGQTFNYYFKYKKKKRKLSSLCDIIRTNNSNHFCCCHVFRALGLLAATVIPVEYVQHSLGIFLLLLFADIARHK